MKEIIRPISCGASKLFKDVANRPFTHGTNDGLNYLTNGKISDYNGDLVHGVMIVSTLALFFPKTRALGVVGWASIGAMWQAGQNPKAVRPRAEKTYCK